VSNDETVPIITAIALLEDQNGMPQHAQFPAAPSEERHPASQEPEIQFGWWSPSIAPPDLVRTPASITSAAGSAGSSRIRLPSEPIAVEEFRPIAERRPNQ
jgi:hypothetical protein